MPHHPNALLDPTKREDVYLEVLVQNAGLEGMVFNRVILEPVVGLVSKRIGSGPTGRGRSGTITARPPPRRSLDVLPSDADTSTDTVRPPSNDFELVDGMATLLPQDTRQYLFLVARDGLSKSAFPPVYPPGTVLPLGRLDLSWVTGPYRDPGRLQTSTLNRRAPGSLRPDILVSPPGPSPTPKDHSVPSWDYDLAVIERPVATLEKIVILKCRLAARGQIGNPPLRLAVQYLSAAPIALAAPPAPPTPAAPSSNSTPLPSPRPPSTSSSISPFTTLTSPSTPTSRSLTPVSTRLRDAAQSSLAGPATIESIPAPAPPFPPLPYLTEPPDRTVEYGAMTGEVHFMGVTMVYLPEIEMKSVESDQGVMYDAPPPETRIEGEWEFELKFLALEPGLASLGGLRVLEADRAAVGKQWDRLGDVWVEDEE